MEIQCFNVIISGGITFTLTFYDDIKYKSQQTCDIPGNAFKTMLTARVSYDENANKQTNKNKQKKKQKRETKKEMNRLIISKLRLVSFEV